MRPLRNKLRRVWVRLIEVFSDQEGVGDVMIVGIVVDEWESVIRSHSICSGKRCWDPQVLVEFLDVRELDEDGFVRNALVVQCQTR